MSANGTIFNIQSYSIHDGPGIRAVVFMKGCSLKCAWCSNPESQNFAPEIYYSRQRCMKCGLCIEACPNGALTQEDGYLVVDRKKCRNCGFCVKVCPTEALTMCGREVCSDEVIKEINRDRDFIMNSGGGITFSGGEPFEQADFLNDIAKKLKKESYHIAVETSGCTEYKNIAKCLGSIDLLLYDLKLASSQLHKKYTGSENNLILDNLKKVYKKVPVIIRIPIIPSVNDTDGQIEELIEIISNISINAEVNLLPYHKLGKLKYSALGMTYQVDEIKTPDDNYMDCILQLFLDKGLKASII